MITVLINRCGTPALIFLLVPLLLLQMTLAESAVLTVEQIQCSYDPDSGQPNPFGSRAFITVAQRGQDTHFRYERFPSLVQTNTVSDTGKARAVTLGYERTMIFYNTELEAARELMRIHNDYYYELIGYIDSAGFSSYDEAMSCG